ncbi:MAG: PAS domain S-box protein [Actinomycetota bacterium]|nr:PAS domain S-box protein [Actinomycetota bacterium]
MGPPVKRLGRLEIFILAVGLVAVLLVAYSTRLSSRLAQEGRLLEASSQSLRSGIILSHLWLEEAMAGDDTINLQRQVYGNIFRARTECLAMLNGVSNRGRTLAPMADPMGRATLGKLCARLHSLDQLTRDRLQNRGGSQAGSPVDQAYDAVFNSILRLAREDREHSSAQIASSEATVERVNALVIVALLGVFSGLALLVRRHHRSLSQLTRRQQLILDSVGEGIYGLDENRRLTFVNPTAARLTGHAPSEVIGKQMHEIVHHSHADGSPYPVEECPTTATLRDGESRQVTQEVLWRKDGSSFPVEYSVNPTEENGRVAGAVVAFRDVTERRRSDEALAVSEQRFRKIFDDGPVGMSMVDAGGHYIRTNHPLRRLLGYSEVELGRLSVLELTHPDDREGDRELMGKLFAGELETYRREKRYITKDGGVVWAALGVSAITDRSGEVVMAVGIVEDITDRKKAEDALHKSQSLLTEAQRLSRTGSWEASMHGDEMLWSDELYRLLGISPGSMEASTETYMGFVHPDDREPLLTAFQNSLSDLSPFGVDHRVVIEAGEVRVLRSEGRVSIDDAGNPLKMTGVVQDVTQQREVEKLKDESTSMVSHELRAPLTSIRGSLGLLSGGVFGPLPEKGQRMLEIASSNAERLVRLVNDILDIERMESGSVSMSKEECEAHGLMTQASEVMQAMAQGAGVNLIVTPVEARLWADCDRIIQTLINLVSNAIKFSPRDGTVWMDAKVDREAVTFSVKDEGRGIPPDKLESVFGRFQQVEANDAREKGGTGLGLAISRSIVQQHGGRTWVESTLGRGSTFFFTLPVTTEAEDANQPEVPTILVCDDDPAILEVVDALLRGKGFHVITTTSGKGAIARAIEERPSAILLDLIMPDMDGWEIASTLKQCNETKDIPIIILSVLSRQKSGGLPADIEGWVDKPFDERSLFRSLDQALSNHPAVSRVLFFESDPELARLLRGKSEAQGLMTFFAEAGEDVRELIRRTSPDLVLMNPNLPHAPGSELVKQLRRDDAGNVTVPAVVYGSGHALEENSSTSVGRRSSGRGPLTSEDIDGSITELIDRLTNTEEKEHSR